MNRSAMNVLFGAFGKVAPEAEGPAAEAKGTVRSIVPEELAVLVERAQRLRRQLSRLGVIEEVRGEAAARPGEADYGRLSAMLTPWLSATRLFELGPGAFQPDGPAASFEGTPAEQVFAAIEHANRFHTRHLDACNELAKSGGYTPEAAKAAGLN